VFDSVKFGMRDITCDMSRAGRVTQQVDARSVAAAAADIAGDPLDGKCDVLRAGRPGRLRRQAIGHGDADKAVSRGPKRDVVVERTSGDTLVPTGERAAVDEDQHGLYA